MPAEPSAQAGSAATARAVAADVDEFIRRETYLIDDGLLDDWCELFHPEGTYWVPGEGTGDTDEISLIHDTIPHLRERIFRLKRGKAASQSPPTHTVHVVSAALRLDRDGERLRCVSNQVIHYARGPRSGALPSRVYYTLEPAGADYLMLLKKVVMLSRGQPLPDLSFFL